MQQNGIDYVCITDIARLKNADEPKDVVKNWMRLKNTVEYLGLWEKLNNPQFKGVGFDPLFQEAGSNAQQDSHPPDAGAGRYRRKKIIAINMEEIIELTNNDAFTESLIEVIHEQLVTDEEPYTKKVQHLLVAYNAHKEIIDDFMISLCGWSMTTLIDMAKKRLNNV